MEWTIKTFFLKQKGVLLMKDSTLLKKNKKTSTNPQKKSPWRESFDIKSKSLNSISWYHVTTFSCRKKESSSTDLFKVWEIVISLISFFLFSSPFAPCAYRLFDHQDWKSRISPGPWWPCLGFHGLTQYIGSGIEHSKSQKKSWRILWDNYIIVYKIR